MDNGPGSNQEADPEEWNHVLAEISNVDDTFVAVEVLQACHRACAITKFTEVVVFQNPCIVPCGNAEKIKTSFQRHRVAEGTLKRRCDINHLRCWAFLWTDSGIQTLRIYGKRYDTQLRALKCRSRARVSRVLHPNRFARIKQRFGTEIQRLLRSGRDYHLVRVAANGARPRDVIADGFPQREVAEGIGVIIKLIRCPSPVLRRQPRPKVKRQAGDIG